MPKKAYKTEAGERHNKVMPKQELTKFEVSIEEFRMLETVKRYSWYINNAMFTKIHELDKGITQGKESMKHDDGATVYRSMEGVIEFAERALKEYKEAHDALKEAGVK